MFNQSELFQYLGIATASYIVIKLLYRMLNNVGTFFLGYGHVNLKKYGSWAIVTGATDGIGKSYANLLAKRGLNVILISRTRSKLDDLAKEIKQKYSVDTKVIAVDFTEQTSIYPKIKEQIGDLDIAILINNVGMFYEPDYLEKVLADDKFTNDIINCNIVSVTKMTGIVLPGMVKRKGGVIVNISSGSGRTPIPLLTIYSSTKAYMDFFSKAAQLEYKSKGIIVQSVCPYFVSTKLSGQKESFTCPNPDKFVSEALKTIGSQQLTNGCISHNIQGFISENYPSYFFDKHLLKGMIKLHEEYKQKN